MPAYAAKPIPQVVRERAHANYTVDEDGCWISGYFASANGYAHLYRKNPETGKNQAYLAHRASWEFVNGPAPADMQIDHKCFKRNCVNPDHLRCVTHLQNAQRRNGTDFPLDGRCRWGHDASYRKTYFYKRAGRELSETRCSACVDEKNANCAAIDQGIRLLELTYELGGHQLKRSYANEMRKRSARIAELAEMAA